MALKLNNFSFAVHSVVQGHFNGATRRRTTPSKDRVPKGVGRSENIGGHWGNSNLRHFEDRSFAFILTKIWGIRLPPLPSGSDGPGTQAKPQWEFFPFWSALFLSIIQ